MQPPDDEPAGLTCRVYRLRDGRFSPTPDPADVREALRMATNEGGRQVGISIGDTAPGFDLPDTEGQRHIARRRPGRSDRGRVHLQPLPLRARLARPHRGCGSRLRRRAAFASSRSTPTTPSAIPPTPTRRCRSAFATSEWPLPYLHDESQEVARAFGAKTTPDVFVLDSDGRLRYRGAPDADYCDAVAERRLAAGRTRRAARGPRPQPGRDGAGGLQRQVAAVIGRVSRGRPHRASAPR